MGQGNLIQLTKQ